MALFASVQVVNGKHILYIELLPDLVITNCFFPSGTVPGTVASACYALAG